jgi:putative DNA primase/helicase
MTSTIERAQGRWREILTQLGIDARFLVNKHGPCPLCRGKNRFRFDDRDGSGSYYCNQCGAGAGLIMIRKLHCWDYATACREVDKIIGRSPQPPASALDTPQRAKAVSSNDAERRRKAILRLLNEARAPNIVADYLMSRGIAARSPVLRGHARCPYFDEAGDLVGHFPAVIAPILGRDGSLESAMRIYLADVGPRKKILPPVSTICGAAVRLHQMDDGVLGVAAGVENAIAAHVMFQKPVWAALCDNGIKTFEPPDGIKHLCIFCDNDYNYCGQAAGYGLAHRLSRDRPEIAVDVHVPTITDADFNDILRRCTA